MTVLTQSSEYIQILVLQPTTSRPEAESKITQLLSLFAKQVVLYRDVRLCKVIDMREAQNTRPFKKGDPVRIKTEWRDPGDALMSDPFNSYLNSNTMRSSSSASMT